MSFLNRILVSLKNIYQADIPLREKTEFLFHAGLSKLGFQFVYYATKIIIDLFRIKLKRRMKYHAKLMRIEKMNASVLNSISDSDLIRIIEAFTKAKIDQTGQSQPYQVGGEWAVMVAEYHKDIRNALEVRDLDGIRRILSNFGRDKVSHGLQLYSALPDSWINKIAYLNYANKAYHNWLSLTDLPEAALEYPRNIGNFPGIQSGESVIPILSFRLSYFGYKIYQLTQSIQHPTISEIGGGFGAIPYHMLKYTDFQLTYIDFDIPEMCVIASYFLISAFPEKRICLYGECSDLKNSDIKGYDIIIMPNYAIKDLPDKWSDLVFNSHSLGEMNRSSVNEYLVQIGRICKRYFLHANDEKSRFYWDPYDGYKFKKRVILSNLTAQLPECNFKKVYRIPEVIFSDGWFENDFFENLYYEYLYERKGEVLF